MAQTVKIKWDQGDGYITVNYTGEGDGTILLSSDPNTSIGGRQQQITVSLSDNPSITQIITVFQPAASGIDGQMAHTPDSDYTRTYDGGSSSTTSFNRVVDAQQ